MHGVIDSVLLQIIAWMSMIEEEKERMEDEDCVLVMEVWEA